MPEQQKNYQGIDYKEVSFFPGMNPEENKLTNLIIKEYARSSHNR